MSTNRLLPLPSKFFVGCNYWASHAGTAMWSDWRPDVIDRDMKLLAEAGIEVMRVFPLWPDFQPIDNMYSGNGQHMGYRFGEERLPDTEAGRAGVSEPMMDRFRQLLDIAESHGIKVIVGLITGWMSGRLFVPNALKGKPILTDPDAIRWQVRFVSYFVNHFKGNDTIAAWDLGNECNCMQVVTQEQAWLWTSAVSNAIKAADGSRPLISGMHSLSPAGNWTMQDQGELTDVLTTHPYPFWTPHMDVDPIDTMRPILHATAENLFYARIGGKPCFAEEMGTMGPMVCGEEVAAAFGRASMLSQWAHGTHGLLWWCANDQTRLNHAPYDWVACEGELGLMTEEGRIKPVLQELGRIKSMINALPIEELPPRLTEGLCILNSAQDHWAAAAGSFLLAKQAGFDLDFQYEDQPIRDAALYVVPCVTGVYGIPKQRWEELLRKVHDGATLYLSVDDGYMLNFAELTGIRVVNRHRRGGEADVTLGKGPDAPVLTMGGSFKLEFRAERAQILATEADGNPAFTKASYGRGTVYFFSLPLELEMIRRPETSHRPDLHPYWKVYEVLARAVTGGRVLQADNPHVGFTEHPADEHTRIAVLINYCPEQITVDALLKPGWRLDEIWYGHAADGKKERIALAIAPNEGTIVKLVRG